MIRPTTDGGFSDKPPQSPERIASAIVSAEVGDGVAVFTSHDDTLSIYKGDVVSTEYRMSADGPGGTHVVAIDVAGDRVAVYFERVIDDNWELATPDPVLFDQQKKARLPVTRFEGCNAPA